jgi:hypothetical protein
VKGKAKYIFAANFPEALYKNHIAIFIYIKSLRSEAHLKMYATVVSYHIRGQHIGKIEILRCFYYRYARTTVQSLDLALLLPDE